MHFTYVFQNDGLAKVATLLYSLVFWCSWEVWNFFQNHFYLALAGFFLLFTGEISNLKILHNSDTVTTQLIHGSWKAENTAYISTLFFWLVYCSFHFILGVSIHVQVLICLFVYAREIIFIPKAVVSPKILD